MIRKEISVKMSGSTNSVVALTQHPLSVTLHNLYWIIGRLIRTSDTIPPIHANLPAKNHFPEKPNLFALNICPTCFQANLWKIFSQDWIKSVRTNSRHTKINILLDSLHCAKSSLTQCHQSIENGAHYTEKLQLKTQVSKDFAQWSESNSII